MLNNQERSVSTEQPLPPITFPQEFNSQFDESLHRVRNIIENPNMRLKTRYLGENGLGKWESCAFGRKVQAVLRIESLDSFLYVEKVKIDLAWDVGVPRERHDGFVLTADSDHTGDNDRAIFVGKINYWYLQWFTSACKGLNAGISPNSIRASAFQAESELVNLRNTIGRKLNPNWHEDYAWPLHRLFCQKLATAQFSSI